MEGKCSRILSSFEKQCARREYCTGDMRRKILKAVEGDAAEAEKLLSKLLEDGYVDDARYASCFARDKSSLAGWGPVKIRYALASKGIPAGIIDAALEDTDAGAASEKLERSLAVKWKSLAGGCEVPPVDAKLKLIRFALSRGYGYDAVREAVEKVTRQAI